MADMVTFEMVRDDNVVADGVVFPDGAAVLRWRGDFSSTGVYASLHQLVSVHGHANTSFFRTCVVNEALIKSKTQNWYQDWCEGVPASGDGPNAQYFAGERDAVLSLMKRVPLDVKQPDKLENSRG